VAAVSACRQSSSTGPERVGVAQSARLCPSGHFAWVATDPEGPRPTSPLTTRPSSTATGDPGEIRRAGFSTAADRSLSHRFRRLRTIPHLRAHASVGGGAMPRKESKQRWCRPARGRWPWRGSRAGSWRFRLTSALGCRARSLSDSRTLRFFRRVIGARRQSEIPAKSGRFHC
jgi:hypothetical protein